MVRTFCTRGESERLKGAVHAAGGALAALMAGYNIAAWCFRRERHLGINAIVYTLAIWWEVKQTAHHLERFDRDCGNTHKPDAPVAVSDLEPRAAA